MVFFGAHNLSNPHEIGRCSMAPSKIYLHDDWNPHTIGYDADIAVFEFDEDINFSRFVQPICLWADEIDPSVNEGFVAGWGQSEDKSKLSQPAPREVKVTIHSNEDCFLQHFEFSRLSSKRTFCAGSTDNDGVCFGDSGSGLMMKHENIFYLKGIVSSSFVDHGECDIKRNSVYTNVIKFRGWINQIMDEVSVPKPEEFRDLTITGLSLGSDKAPVKLQNGQVSNSMHNPDSSSPGNV